MFGRKLTEKAKQKRRDYKHIEKTKKIISRHSKGGNNPNAKIVLCNNSRRRNKSSIVFA